MIPEGITTAIVHMDAPISFVGEPGRLHVTIEPSVSLIWTATGTPMGNFVDVLELDPGAEMRVELPHTDQAGFQDAQGNTYTGWYYSITVIYERNGHRIAFPRRDFQILTGQVEVDLALVPADEAVPVPAIAPILPVTSLDGLTGEVTMVELGLDRVDNTNDLEKPISTATQTALDAKADDAATTAALGTKADAAATQTALDTKADAVATQTALDGKAAAVHRHTYSDIDGVVPTSALPPLAINDTFPVASQAAMLALVAQRGDMAIRTDLNKSFVLATDSPGTLADWKEVMAAGQVISVAGKTGTVALVKADVGLSNVDNTSDVNKPLSTATQAALNGKAADDGLLKGTLGRKFRIIAGTIRNTGAGWQVLDDAGHRPTGVTGVTVAPTTIDIAFASTAKVVSFVCGADETFAARGLRFGASVGASAAKVSCYQSNEHRISDYVTYNGSTWSSLNGVFTGITFDGAGKVSLNHEDMGTALGGSVNARPPIGAAANTIASLGSQGATLTIIELRTPAGAVITNAASNTALWVERAGQRKSAAVDPATLVEAEGNIWFIGVVEE